MTAQKYLGLTRELIRTEKAINELACYPLDAKFWEVGGAEKFRLDFKSTSNTKSDLFNNIRSSYISGASTFRTFPQVLREAHLNSSKTNQNDIASNTENGGSNGYPTRNALDLRDAVMESISKAIGLVQSSDTPTNTTTTSPVFKPQDHSVQTVVLDASVGNLAFLGKEGHKIIESSPATSSLASLSILEPENEIEILNFPQGSVLVKSGEKNPGLYFVMEGFLEVSMEDSATSFIGSTEKKEKLVPLFTVKAGGIAGYLSSLSGFPSYVTITAKTECFVGFLPSKALDRIMDRNPIILLTLAKRLISLLSPLSKFNRQSDTVCN